MQSNASPSPAARRAVFCVKWEPSNFLSSSTFSDDTVPPLPASQSQLMWTWRIFVAAASRTNFLPFPGNLLEVFLTPAKSIALRCPFKSWRCRATCFFVWSLWFRGGRRGGGRRSGKVAGEGRGKLVAVKCLGGGSCPKERKKKWINEATRVFCSGGTVMNTATFFAAD